MALGQRFDPTPWQWVCAPGRCRSLVTLLVTLPRTVLGSFPPRRACAAARWQCVRIVRPTKDRTTGLSVAGQRCTDIFPV